MRRLLVELVRRDRVLTLAGGAMLAYGAAALVYWQAVSLRPLIAL